MNNDYVKAVDALDIKTMKKINKILTFSAQAEMSLTQDEIVNKYVNVKNNHGEEVALRALDSTLKNFKRMANEAQKAKWNKVKSELLELKGFTPSSIRVIQSDIRNGNIDINGLPSEEWIRKELNIYKTT
jgi:hypothetical protein